MNDYSKTYKSKLLSEITIGIMKTLVKKQGSIINFLQDAWMGSVPEWAKNTKPYMIKNKMLFIKAPSSQASVLQYRESEFLKILRSLLPDSTIQQIEKIKIIPY